MSDLCFTYLRDTDTGVRCVAIYERGRMHRPHVIMRARDFKQAVRHLRPVGKGLREIRKEKGFETQEALAEAVGTSRTYMSQIESGAAENLTLKMALRICEVLDASVSDLFPHYYPTDR